jgi:hypothetical protein
VSSALDPHCEACGAEKVRASSASGANAVVGWKAVCVSQHEDGVPFYIVGQITWNDSRGLGLRVEDPAEVIVFEWEMVMCLGQTLSVMQTPEEVFNP